MNGIALIVALVCVATAQANPLNLLLESSQTAASKFILTPEDVTTFIRITEQEQALYSTLLTENLADFGLLLNSRVIAAYNVSQNVGQCAIVLARQTSQEWYGTIETSQQTITNSTDTIKNALYTAETPEEVFAALKLYSEYKKINFEYFMQFVGKISESYVNVADKIAKCNN